MNDNMEFGSEIQHKVWEVEQEILDVVVDVCDKNNLKYSLAYGTLLGAVRHKGFIPWDDDIDIMMPREDYEKLREIWNNVAPKGYILQERHTDLDYPNNFIKIRKDHTTFIQSDYDKKASYHKGIFIDIFPTDKVAKGTIRRKIQFIWFAIYSLYVRGYGSGTKGFIGIVERIFLKLPRKRQVSICNCAEKKMCSWNHIDKSPNVVFCTIDNSKMYYPDDLFAEFTTVEFNGKKYKSFKKYEQMLKVRYGDYMKLPPKEERVWSHHPLLIDFERNYEEIVGENDA